MSECARALSEELLLDWWAGELAPEVRRDVELHLMSCASCAQRADGLAALADALRGVVREGGVPLFVTAAVAERLRREGRRIREYRVEPGGGVQCTVGPDDDVVLARLRAELSGVRRLDLVSRIDDGPEQRVPDLPFDAAAGELTLMSHTAELRARPAHVERMRLVAVEPEGERVLGEYTFDHTPWPGR